MILFKVVKEMPLRNRKKVAYVYHGPVMKIKVQNNIKLCKTFYILKKMQTTNLLERHYILLSNAFHDKIIMFPLVVLKHVKQ